MTEYTVSVFKCPKCGYITNKPIDRKTHETLKCGEKMEVHTLIYAVYSKCVTLVIDKLLTLDVFIK